MTTNDWDPNNIGAVAPEELPVGTEVDYYPVLNVPGMDERLRTVTRNEPWQLGHGAWVASVVGITGGVLLSHLRKVILPPMEE